jgi:exopolysaccharide biosynthesis protein
MKIYFWVLIPLLTIIQFESKVAVSQTIANRESWQLLAEDLWLFKKPIEESTFFNPELILIKTSLKKYRLATLRAADFGKTNLSIKNLTNAHNALLGINANFFDENNKAIGLVVSKGNTYQKVHNGGSTLTGIFSVSSKSLSIVNRTEYQPISTLEAIQAGPRLISQGSRIQGLRNLDTKSRRSGICLDAQKNVIFFISNGFSGITLNDLIELLLSKEINCYDALNLDGGGSAQLYLKLPSQKQDSEITEINIPGNDYIPVGLGLKIK